MRVSDFHGQVHKRGLRLDPQNDGDHLYANFSTTGQLRGFTFYGMTDAYVVMESGDYYIDDIVAQVWASNDPTTCKTSNVFVHYINKAKTGGHCGNSVF